MSASWHCTLAGLLGPAWAGFTTTCQVEMLCSQARLANTQTVQDLLKLAETLQHEKSRLQSREQRDAADALKLQQALAELRAAHSMVKVSRDILKAADLL